jgi:hypothetical protein
VPHLVKFDEAKRQELFRLGRRDLFFFTKGILGFKDLSEEFHWELSRFVMRGFDPRLLQELQREGIELGERWNRGLVCTWRGSLKSSIANIGLIAHQSIYVESHSTMLIEQKSDNAKINHFLPINDLFRNSRQADFLQWLYRERIPEGFAGWTTEQIAFLSDDPLSGPSIRYGGIDSAYEGVHVNLIVVDDPEGADAEKGDAPNAESYRLVMRRAPPLLIHPERDRILLIATPHGDDPIVHKIREKASSAFAIFWREVVDSEGRSRWPERFTERTLATLKLDRELWDKQYMLLKSSSENALFDLDMIRENCYEWAARNQLISYPIREVDPDRLDDSGYPTITQRRGTIALEACRFFLHCDPKHKDRASSTKQSQAAIVVAAVAPDFNVFTVETWAEAVGLEKFAERVFFLYRKWAPAVVTMEFIGAQSWFRDYAKALEGTKYKRLVSLPLFGREALPLPRLTSRLVEAEKMNEQKEGYIIGQLAPWLHTGRLHVRADQDHLLTQLEHFPQPTGLKDLLDALAQGPSVWKAPVPYHPLNELRRRKRYLDLIQTPDPHTGYQRPWKDSGVN